MRRYRIISQAIFLVLLLSLFIFTRSSTNNNIFTKATYFLYFDPYIAISYTLASKKIITVLLLCIITIVLTAILGRVFCGWVCPLGTLNDLISLLNRSKSEVIKKNHLRYKYYILLFSLGLALTGINISGFIDPLSIIIRSFTIIIYPLLNLTFHSFYEIFTHLFSDSELPPRIYSFLRDYIIENHRIYFFQSILIGTIFIVILFANLIMKRFWCKYMCPLGALLGIIGRYSIVKKEIGECRDCNLCQMECSGGAISISKSDEISSECILCMNCTNICPDEAISFRISGKSGKGAIDLGKRNTLISISSSILFYSLFRSSITSSSNFSSARLIRPPGAIREDLFVRSCIKCGLCMKVCINNCIQPTLFEAGFEGMWTPYIVPRINYCEYNCNLCSQVCPTDAIRKITVEEKHRIKIGTAQIDKNRCLPYRDGIGCLVCEEVCPVPDKAIKREKTGVQINNETRYVLAPRVVSSLCIGCGVCEKHCPVNDSPAIYVTSAGESRSKENQNYLE